MSVFQTIVVGAVQGATEFIPVSSSGHLVLVPEALGWPRTGGLTFDVLLHTASLLALLVYFSGDLSSLARGVVTGDAATRRLAGVLLVGSIPAGIAGVAFGGFFEERFEDPPVAALTLLVTAAVLTGGERVLAHHQRRAETAGRPLKQIADLRWHDGLVVGLAQAAAIFPGLSRSGSTISAGLVMGARRDDAARFAFLLAIPALIGATLVKLPDLGAMEIGTGAALAGFLSSLVASYAAIAGLIRFLKTHTVYPFAIYVTIAAFFFYVIVR